MNENKAQEITEDLPLTPVSESITPANNTDLGIDELIEKKLVEKIELFLNDHKLSSTMGKNGILRVKTIFDLEQHHQTMRNLLLSWIQRSSKNT